MSRSKEEKAEILADLRDSPAWDFFANEFVARLLVAAGEDILESSRPGTGTNESAHAAALYASGKRDGMLDLIAAVYGDSPVPEHLRKQRSTL